jgi:retron-type reverse transcriptase
MNGRIKWILDADIQGCFDNFDHNILRELLSKRNKDRNLLRLIDLWLKAGIIDGKSLHRNTVGTPQGNIASPLLCNVYLHYVLDEWVEKIIRPLLKGKIFIIR